jgi:hypothetical protein
MGSARVLFLLLALSFLVPIPVHGSVVGLSLSNVSVLVQMTNGHNFEFRSNDTGDPITARAMQMRCTFSGFTNPVDCTGIVDYVQLNATLLNATPYNASNVILRVSVLGHNATTDPYALSANARLNIMSDINAERLPSIEFTKMNSIVPEVVVTVASGSFLQPTGFNPGSALLGLGREGFALIAVIVGTCAILFVFLFVRSRKRFSTRQVRQQSIRPGVYCSKCGAAMRAESKFCRHCGSSL